MIAVQNIVRQLWRPRTTRGRNPFLMALLPFSLAYGSITGLRNLLYDTGFFKEIRLPCPVISIGNITVGGTGKTPLTILMAKGLLARGFRPAVLSRGYGGRRTDSGNVVSDGRRILMHPEDCGDEPILMAGNLFGVPVITGPNRVISGRVAIESFAADLLILDDAFQHRRLARDVNVVLIDGQYPFGNGLLLPAGPLREAPAIARKRIDIIVKTGNDFNDLTHCGGNGKDREGGFFKGLLQPVFRAHYKPRGIAPGGGKEILTPEILKGKKIYAFTGIAAPDKFRATIEDRGGEIIKFLAFPDHYFYKEDDVEKIKGEAKARQADYIVTTEKDGVKLVRYQDFYHHLHILKVELSIEASEDIFFDTLIGLLKR